MLSKTQSGGRPNRVGAEVDKTRRQTNADRIKDNCEATYDETRCCAGY